jgi:hypothetical protein
LVKSINSIPRCAAFFKSVIIALRNDKSKLINFFQATLCSWHMIIIMAGPSVLPVNLAAIY